MVSCFLFLYTSCIIKRRVINSPSHTQQLGDFSTILFILRANVCELNFNDMDKLFLKQNIVVWKDILNVSALDFVGIAFSEFYDTQILKEI